MWQHMGSVVWWQEEIRHQMALPLELFGKDMRWCMMGLAFPNLALSMPRA